MKYKHYKIRSQNVKHLQIFFDVRPCTWSVENAQGGDLI